MGASRKVMDQWMKVVFEVGWPNLQERFKTFLVKKLKGET